MVFVKSPSPSEISLRVSATLTIGAVVELSEKNITTAAIIMAITAIIIVILVRKFTSFKMYDFFDASIKLHESPVLPIEIGAIVISTSEFNTDE